MAFCGQENQILESGFVTDVYSIVCLVYMYAIWLEVLGIQL